MIVQVNGFERVDLGQSLRQARLEGGGQFAGPTQTGIVGGAINQRQSALNHFKRNPILEFYFAPDVGRLLGHGLGVGVVTDVFGGCAVVHPHQIAAGALGHHGQESVGGGARRGGKEGRDVTAKAPKVIGGDQGRAVVMLGIIGQQREGLTVQ